jgi:hypothetical protein
MKIFATVVLSLSLTSVIAQTICNPSGDWMIFSNYDGGTLNIVVDANIPNLKIGVVSYEAVSMRATTLPTTTARRQFPRLLSMARPQVLSPLLCLCLPPHCPTATVIHPSFALIPAVLQPIRVAAIPLIR